MTDSPKRYESWGRFPTAKPAKVLVLQSGEDDRWRDEASSVLPFGQGRSYGDTCLNNGGILLDTASLARVIDFDKELGILRCEAGTTLADILALIVPHNWFLPVIPAQNRFPLAGVTREKPIADQRQDIARVVPASQRRIPSSVVKVYDTRKRSRVQQGAAIVQTGIAVTSALAKRKHRKRIITPAVIFAALQHDDVGGFRNRITPPRFIPLWPVSHMMRRDAKPFVYQSVAATTTATTIKPTT